MRGHTSDNLTRQRLIPSCTVTFCFCGKDNHIKMTTEHSARGLTGQRSLEKRAVWTQTHRLKVDKVLHRRHLEFLAFVMHIQPSVPAELDAPLQMPIVKSYLQLTPSGERWPWGGPLHGRICMRRTQSLSPLRAVSPPNVCFDCICGDRKLFNMQPCSGI